MVFLFSSGKETKIAGESNLLCIKTKEDILIPRDGKLRLREICTNELVKLTLIFLVTFPQINVLAQTPLPCHVFTVYYPLSNPSHKL